MSEISLYQDDVCRKETVAPVRSWALAKGAEGGCAEPWLGGMSPAGHLNLPEDAGREDQSPGGKEEAMEESDKENVPATEGKRR